MYELLALKDLIQNDLISVHYVSPIIEPVKDGPTFRNLLTTAKGKNFKLNVISNPKVGTFKNEAQIKQLIQNNHMRTSFIVDSNFNQSVASDDLIFYQVPKKILNSEKLKTTINVMPDSLIYRSAIGTPKYSVVFQDCFNKQTRNADYTNIPEETFSQNHLLYIKAGYYGFGDYSIIGKDIGKDYSDSGFAPYAVAVHIVYFDENKELRIKHFVSDSNDDIYNPALKLHEALKKLHSWYDNSHFNKYMNDSIGLRQLNELFLEDRYPGLGF